MQDSGIMMHTIHCIAGDMVQRENWQHADKPEHASTMLYLI